jgi:hypothetical protein
MSLVLFSYFSIVRLLVNGEYLYTFEHTYNTKDVQKMLIFISIQCPQF